MKVKKNGNNNINELYNNKEVQSQHLFCCTIILKTWKEKKEKKSYKFHLKFVNKKQRENQTKITKNVANNEFGNVENKSQKPKIK